MTVGDSSSACSSPHCNATAIMPNAPRTADEAGVPGLYVDSGLWAPRATPKDVVAKLNGAVVEALGDPRICHRLAEIGQEIPRAISKPQRLLRLCRKQNREAVAN
jgi:tripartite-type tricarboxylate transporter receptor subunit TctC